MNNDDKIKELKQLLKELHKEASTDDFGHLAIWPSDELFERLEKAIKD